jgi:hemolysin III
MTESRPESFLFRHLREPINSLTHFVGVLLSIAGLVVLLVLSAGEPWRTVGFSIYGTSLIVLYSASTLLHGLKVGASLEKKLRIFDHAAIFGLIAGTYTPVTLIALQSSHPAWGWTLLSVAWGFALLGILFKIFWIGAPRWLSVGLYLVMGWLALAALVPIVDALPWGGIAWMLIGGAFYSGGAVIYALKRPDLWPGVFGYHELWHLFVLAGSISHFVMMLKYVLPY